MIALGAVMLGGAASNATVGHVGGEDPSTAPRAALDVAPSDATATAAAAERARVAEAAEASRGRAREPLQQAVAERRDQSTLESSGSDASTSGTARAKSVVPDDPREIAESMLDEYGWDSYEMECLDQLWVSESNWDVNATNPTSGAYGIPQALPAGKMASAGSDWRTNPATQIEWGLKYIDLSYGSPCSAWEFKQANNWY